MIFSLSDAGSNQYPYGKIKELDFVISYSRTQFQTDNVEQYNI